MRRSTPERLANVCMHPLHPQTPLTCTAVFQLLGFSLVFRWIFSLLLYFLLHSVQGIAVIFRMEHYFHPVAFSTANLFKVTAACSDGARLPTRLGLHRAQSWICTTIFSSFDKASVCGDGECLERGWGGDKTSNIKNQKAEKCVCKPNHGVIATASSRSFLITA